MSIELLSFGDRIADGTYRIHSKFTSVINFVSGDKMISLINKEREGGPGNICIKCDELPKSESITIRNRFIYFDDTKITLTPDKIYNSSLKLSGADEISFSKNVDVFGKALVTYSQEKSLAFLIDETKENEFSSGFERHVLEKIKSGVDHILSGDVLTGVKNIKGVGFGLTPSGNDFIAGMLWGLFLSSNIYDHNYTEIRGRIITLSKSNCLISNTMLSHAKEGYVFENLKNLLISLLYENEKKTIKNTKKLLNMGNTSGSDLATGLFLTLKYHRKMIANKRNLL